ncbi:unnamed protein product [Spodoptera littoralis]|uniref:Uncharacterized protein n=1 Tax=Spodoptera littoralis TaxID=7109 RepID=A0A9P0N528_SPOLI|nr:unnamed protein product [Spodoptera littoralis]CAH1641809.1 unnamed protein product [Spodoptera littoralis]
MTSTLDEARFEVQNEIKTTETKVPKKKNTTVVKIHEILKLDEVEKEIVPTVDAVDNTKVNNIENDSEILDIMDLTELNYSRIPKHDKHSVNKNVGHSEAKQMSWMREYWVQANIHAHAQPLPPGTTPFTYAPDRNSFVQLVFFLVLIMLIVTSSFVYMVYASELKETFLRSGFLFGIIGMVGIMALSYAMACIPITRVPPCNFICLMLAVFFMSLIVAWITARYETPLIFVALMSTTVVVLVCLALACSSFDFTQFMLYLVAVSVAFMAVVMIIMITQMAMGFVYKPLHIFILVIGTIIQVVFLIMELQMILGGKTVELSEDDYAYGAFMLYTSIVNLFLNILQLLGFLDD